MKKSINLDLGIVSAYGEAVLAGYTGTKEEFYDALIQIGDVHALTVDAENAAKEARQTVEDIREYISHHGAESILRELGFDVLAIDYRDADGKLYTLHMIGKLEERGGGAQPIVGQAVVGQAVVGN